jgi:uncharacterized protein DUF5335
MTRVPTLEIPKDQWLPYFNDFSKRHYGWGVTLEVLGSDLGDQPVAQGPPLQGLSYEKAGSEAGDILVEIGDAGFPYEVHHVDRPRRVLVTDSDPGAETDIRIESEDGVVTLVRLRPRPELPPA